MKLKLIFVVLLSALIAYSGFWFFLFLRTGSFLETAARDLAENGVEVAYSDYSVGGFPYRIEVVFEDFGFRFQNGSVVYELETPALEVVTHPWKLGHFILFSNEAEAEIALGPGKWVQLKPETTSISFIDGREKGYRLSMVMENLAVRSGLSFPMPAKLQTLSTHIRKDRTASPADSPLLEPRLLEIALNGSFPDETGFNLLTSFRGAEVPELNKTGLEAWRAAGGTFEIESFQHHGPGGTILGSGSFTVDREFRPLGSFGMEGVSNQALIDFFLEAGLLDRPKAEALEGFIAGMPESSGGETGFALGLTAQGGILSLGPVALTDLDPVIQE